MTDFISRQRRQQRNATNQRRGWLTWGAILGIIGLVFYLLINNAIRPPYGEEIPDMGAEHIPDGSDPGEYNSDPPTSGPHYAQPLEPGFYEEADLADLGPFPHAAAVHNLEHGYIVFWYNCDDLDETSCEELKAHVRDYMEGSWVTKLVAFPWHGNDAPLVLTSWGYMLKMPEFSARESSRFINANRMRAPEPNAP